MLKRLAVGLVGAFAASLTLAGMAMAETLTVKTLDGRTISLTVALTDTVASVKVKIMDKEGIPPDQQNLLFRGVILADARTLTEYGIADNATMFLVLSQRGE